MNAIITPPEPGQPQRHLISAAEYLRMGETGVFAPDARLELIEGEIIEMAPMGSPHASVVSSLLELFAQRKGPDATLRVQCPLRLGDISVPEPDLALLQPRQDQYYHAHPVAEDVLLAVEVADATLAFDLGTKAALYARAGIPELWVVDVNERSIRVFREPDANGFRSSFTATGGERIACAALPQIELAVSDAFPVA